ncbi:PEP-utilizing enzyme [Helicobacter sp. MIT 21-1697]|uniref:PEP-utilizing enzyme n=1 Tax=Helicobacter sp. MIT 21-1697 TaxID=2993733 RepID=UPI00224A4A4A|nr:PEP-utilizing enzyme [Helicobacter sp. MIT 21-1697]MCX2717431.1 PEP-utilizing enzyme [Helicobacter sp. MIT 21-1697]
MHTLSFSTKARNLEALSTTLKSAKILPLCLTSLEELESNEAEVLARIKFFSTKAQKLIIRSSSKSEDSAQTSNAGAFLSLANINVESQEAILEALHKVGASMPNKDDEILIQPMLERISMCGVAMSADKDTLAPYYCIEWDKSGSNSAITEGSAKGLSFFAHKQAALPKEEDLKSIILMLRELEELFDYPFLDVEFALDSQRDLYCLQVRPLVIKDKLNLYEALPFSALERLQKRIVSLQKQTSDIYGKRAIFGVMPDWNPAEILGLKPKRLALSLYKEIITDNIWAYQRDNYGYLNLRSHPLMHCFLGIPYIDVRLSFNSFIPKALDKKIASKLVDYYLDTLEANPHLHDKIEFNIVFSCYDFNIPRKLKNLLAKGFNENETKRLEFALLELTNSIINPKKGLYIKDLKKIARLEKICKEVEDSNLPILDKIYWLLESCKRYGTLPFAGIARAGFVAMSLLNSLVEIGFFTLEEKQAFLNSLKTISKELSLNVATLKQENKAEFLSKFGHLRPSTYNILSPRYDEDFESYFDLGAKGNLALDETPFALDSKKLESLNMLLSEHGLKIGAKEFLEFLKRAIEGREYAKFEFTKLLSRALSLIGELGDYYGIPKEEMAHLDIQNILNLYASLYSKNPKERFVEEIKRHKEEYALTLALKLPVLITDVEQIVSFKSAEIVPNFITQKSVSALTSDLSGNEELEGKIVLIKSADPGFDYLFAKNIAGLITCYGGANSHMAIRASELGLPAAIGVGEENFTKFLKAKRIKLDCESGQIVVL